MYCFVINAHTQTISKCSLSEGTSPIASLIGFDSIESDEISGSSDRLYFDDSCFIRDQPTKGRFKLDNLPPVAGIGVVAGVDTGAGPSSPLMSLSDISARVSFIL
jgi:hypothetical protein